MSATSFEDAKNRNRLAQQMLDDVHQQKRAAALKDGAKTFDNAPRNQYGPNAFDRAGGPRTTSS